MDFACNRSACLNCYDETELFKVLQESEAEINPDVKEYTDLMKILLGALIAQLWRHLYIRIIV